jgi:hypothetical protein
MNIPQFFVAKRPIAWTAMISVLVWGVYAYIMMPQRQDPIFPVVTGVVLTPYPGAEAEKVDQEVTRKIERKVAENPAVEYVKSISRPGISIVYVELFETERNAELVWQDVRGKLGEITDLPVAAGKPTQSLLNKDFGDSVAVMQSTRLRSQTWKSNSAPGASATLSGSAANRPRQQRRTPSTVGRAYWCTQTASHAPTSSGWAARWPSGYCIPASRTMPPSSKRQVPACLMSR